MGFLATNQHRGNNYTLSRLFSVQKKRGFGFVHLRVPYRATVYTVEDHDYHWLNIELPNDGFRGVLAKGTNDGDDWVALSPRRTLEQFPGLAVTPYYSSARVTYDAAGRSIRRTRARRVTYEPGYPYMDDQAELGPNSYRCRYKRSLPYAFEPDSPPLSRYGERKALSSSLNTPRLRVRRPPHNLP